MGIFSTTSQPLGVDTRSWIVGVPSNSNVGIKKGVDNRAVQSTKVVVFVLLHVQA